MKKILVTGGCGYIGGHTIVDLVGAGFEVISVDDLSRGSMRMNAGIEKLLGRSIKNYNVNLCDAAGTRRIFEENTDIAGIIHFAAFKSVPESVAEPLMYFRNNIGSLVNILQCAVEFGVKSFVFSSSCSVYGNDQKLPVGEDAPLADPESPYARTKVMGEQICADLARVTPGLSITLLRYFNPVGAHPSGLIGELQEKPENLVPVITQTAIGKRASMTVFGTDYDTRDGSCVRDYIHVLDIAAAHTKALQYTLAGRNESNCEVFNLGTGEGVTVLEMIAAFEKVSGEKLSYERGPRRPGDVVAVYANNDKARNLLGWEIKYDLDASMDTAWKWEKVLAGTVEA
jgi:UDP-glucose 4-epimerase